MVACRNAYGRPEVIPNREGQNVTPSVVYFGADPPAVGQEAKEWARLGNDEIASFFKPHMGDPLLPAPVPRPRLQRHRPLGAGPAAAEGGRRGEARPAGRPGGDHRAGLLRRPPAQGDDRRGPRGGLEVLRIINEPTAAALAYGLQKSGDDETVLIYDLGGGTFDVTVARITPDEIAVLSTAGDHDLGGKNWDDRIATFLAEKFAADTGIDPLDDPVGAQRGARPERAGEVGALRADLDADHPPARHRAARATS